MTLERQLAALLRGGTWIATLVTAIGLCLPGREVTVVGIGLFVALPIVRLAAMLVAYLRARDWRFVATAAAVLVIVIAGIALGAIA